MKFLNACGCRGVLFYEAGDYYFRMVSGDVFKVIISEIEVEIVCDTGMFHFVDGGVSCLVSKRMLPLSCRRYFLREVKKLREKFNK